MMEIVKKQKYLIEEASKKEQQRMRRKGRIETRILDCLQRFRQRYQAKQKLKADREVAKEAMQTFKLTEERRLELEEEILSMKEVLEFHVEDCVSANEMIKLKIKFPKLSYSSMYFSFSEGVIVWKKSANPGKPDGKVYLSMIEEVGIEKDYYFYFVGACN